MIITPEWAAVGVTVLGALLWWGFTIERRMGRKLTREEHTRICEEHQRQLSSQLTTLQATLDERQRATEMYRGRMWDQINDLRVEVAVLQDRANIYNQRRHPMTPSPGPAPI